MEKDVIKKYIEEIEHLAEDVNEIEINSHIVFGELKQWLNAWQGAMKQCVENIKEVLYWKTTKLWYKNRPHQICRICRAV